MTSAEPPPAHRIAVIVPCYKVADLVGEVVAAIGPEVSAIYAVDDACPEHTGDRLEQTSADPRLVIIRHDRNQGVGAATLTGMERAIEDGATILIKLDGDGQMDPTLIGSLITPILNGEADYTKGNRFFNIDRLNRMPAVRLVGNAILSFLSKLSSGYWDIFDPTNGLFAIHHAAFRDLPRHKLDRRFFFESDMLFRLYVLGAVVIDIPMDARYNTEKSNLRIEREFFRFLGGHLRNFAARIFYTYFLRNFSIGSLYLVFGIPLFLFGLIFGLTSWIDHAREGTTASAGTVMLAGLPIIVGLQMLLAFLTYDVSQVPHMPYQRRQTPRAGAPLHEKPVE